MAMSRRCTPYTPHTHKARGSIFALITSAGVHPHEQEPFDVRDENSWHVPPGDAQNAQLMRTHNHAGQSVNCIFPLDRLYKLARASKTNLSFMNYTQSFRDLSERAAPAMDGLILRSTVDEVPLTAGCPPVTAWWPVRRFVRDGNAELYDRKIEG